jgi:hypothetical protein
VAGTRAGFGRDTPADTQLKEVTILDEFENAASVKIVAPTGSTASTWLGSTAAASSSPSSGR